MPLSLQMGRLYGRSVTGSMKRSPPAFDTSRTGPSLNSLLTGSPGHPQYPVTAIFNKLEFGFLKITYPVPERVWA
jgi:hypothetical protein